MKIANSDSKLSDIISQHPEIVPVLNRLGIRLGVGDDTVAMACGKTGMSVGLLVNIINAYINESYFPKEKLNTIDRATLVDYLKKTNIYYRFVQLPNIERHFNLFLAKSDNANNSLTLLMGFFLELKEELLRRIDADESSLFPAILKIDDDTSNEPICTSDSIEEKLTDLKNMFIIHLSGDYDVNLCNAVLITILSLDKDIRQNDRIRSLLLASIR